MNTLFSIWFPFPLNRSENSARGEAITKSENENLSQWTVCRAALRKSPPQTKSPH